MGGGAGLEGLEGRHGQGLLAGQTPRAHRVQITGAGVQPGGDVRPRRGGRSHRVTVTGELIESLIEAPQVLNDPPHPSR